ncbi:methylcrotonoyl-CoA carboxylase beta chain, mitochondrial-like [Ptychodera flava]|uniref:methylcrotonoyl-CoA carboxylase beta chain, mitochondrial-like n=1 Tax=Ptychodera flava TaxID=63121 RepID=UPI003969D075
MHALRSLNFLRSRVAAGFNCKVVLAQHPLVVDRQVQTRSERSKHTTEHVRGRRGRILDGTIDLTSEVYAKRLEYSKQLEAKYEQLMAVIRRGGGDKARERHTQKNKKVLPRERLKMLVDNDGEDFIEFSPFAGLGLQYGDVPAAGVITGVGWINGVPCMITANDATIKGGTLYPIGVKKQLRAQEIATLNRLPCVYIVDSGGAFLPLQADIFPGEDHGGRTFYNEAVMSSMKIPQVAIVCGSCTAGGAYVPTMADEAVIVKGIGTIFLGGPPLVYAAIGEVVSAEKLGGADLHCRVSGCTDHYAENEEEAFTIGRDIVNTLNVPSIYDTPSPQYEDPLFPAENLAAFATTGPNQDIDMHKVLAHIIDGSYFHEFKSLYGPTLITGFAHICGHLVGIVANQGSVSHNAALKGAHFVEICCQRDIPIIFLQNTTSSDSPEPADQQRGSEGNALRAKAKLMATIACAEVPKITVVVGGSYHTENLLMCGRSFDPKLLWIWPNATLGVQDDPRDAFYSTARLWDDGIILPQNTRQVLRKSLSVVKHFSESTTTKYGVLRM